VRTKHCKLSHKFHCKLLQVSAPVRKYNRCWIPPQQLCADYIIRPVFALFSFKGNNKSACLLQLQNQVATVMIRDCERIWSLWGGRLRPKKDCLARWPRWQEQLLPCLFVHPPICPHATSLLLLDWFSWFTLVAVTNICPEILSLDKTGQKCTSNFCEGLSIF
jgi:hypothetical protein